MTKKTKGVSLGSALRTLARLRTVAHVPAEDLAAALHPHLKAQHLIALAQYLEGVGKRMWLDPKQSATRKKCAVCGSEFEHKILNGGVQLQFVRADARYCSAKCKQKAYRKRVAHIRTPTNAYPSRVTDRAHVRMP